MTDNPNRVSYLESSTFDAELGYTPPDAFSGSNVVLGLPFILIEINHMATPHAMTKGGMVQRKTTILLTDLLAALVLVWQLRGAVGV